MRARNICITIIAAVLALGAAGYCGYAFCTDLYGELHIAALIAIFVAVLAVGTVVVELSHECAHLFMGLICSMGVRSVKIRFFRSSSVDVYPKGAKRMKARLVLTAGAGLFADLFLIALGFVALFVEAVPTSLAAVLPYALYQFVVNAFPAAYSGGNSDGLVVWEALKGDPSAQVMLAILRVQGMVHAGTKLEDVDENLLTDLPQLPEDDINFIILTQIRYEYYLAKGDKEKADKYLERFNSLSEYLPDEYKK